MDKKKLFKTILRYIALTIAGAVVGVGIYSAVSASAFGSFPMPFGYGAAVVMSGSMEPELSVGDLIIVKDTGDYEVDDVVVFNSGGTRIVHKIVSIDGDEITTQGTANNTEDAPIGKDAIYGEVVAELSGVGHVVDLLKNPIVFLSIAALVVVLCELSIRREKEEKAKDIDAIKKEINKLKGERK